MRREGKKVAFEVGNLGPIQLLNKKTLKHIFTWDSKKYILEITNLDFPKKYMKIKTILKGLFTCFKVTLSQKNL